VLVLLPPSEGKSAPNGGPPLDLASLSLPALEPARRAAITALTRLCSADATQARAVLGLSERQGDEVARNAALGTAPTAPAAEVYSGVLYQALAYADLARPARRRLDAWVLVWSGLFGAVRLTDRVPAYRLAGSVSLPPLGPLPAFWRPHLAAALAELAGEHVVLDLRSGTYAAAWTAPAGRALVGRVIHDTGGRRTVASHFNKATKGRLVRALAEQGGQPGTPDELIDAIRSAGFRAELAHPGAGSSRKPPVLDIIVTAL
jgi:hypothetical protein